MDPQNPPYRMAIRSHIRSQMQQRGLLEFCDEEADTVQSLELAYMSAGLDWKEEADQLVEVPLSGVAASSTDHPFQSIGVCGTGGTVHSASRTTQGRWFWRSEI